MNTTAAIILGILIGIAGCWVFINIMLNIPMDSDEDEEDYNNDT